MSSAPAADEAALRERLGAMLHDGLATEWRERADDIAQACETCMYYARHRGFCELPELRLPVEPRWSCRLWRI